LESLKPAIGSRYVKREKTVEVWKSNKKIDGKVNFYLPIFAF
jgi:hypothetical protein